MKKTQALVLALVVLLSYQKPAVCQQSITVNPVISDTLITIQEFRSTAPVRHKIATQAMAKGEKPGEFTGVTYRYTNNVRPLSARQLSQLAMKQDGLLDISSKPAFIPHPDTVYVDPRSDLVFQTMQVSDAQMLMLRPRLSAVFEDIEIPEQEVGVTLANTISLAEGIVASAVGYGKEYAVNLVFNKTKFQLYQEKKDSLIVTLTGQITVANPRIEGKYSKYNGYKLVFKTSEQVDLKVDAKMTFSDEKEIPLWGTEIKAGDLGKCKLTVSLLITGDGQVNLTADINQGIDIALGAKGGTFFYVPTSIDNISTLDHYCNIGYTVKSKLSVFAGILCQANLKIRSYNALDIYARGGMEGTVETDGTTLTADIGARVKAGGKVVTKSFTVLDKYYSLYKLQIADMKGYKMFIHEACAYGDYVVGEVYRENGSDSVPYNGSLTVMVRHADNKISQYPARTDAQGLFVVSGVPLKKGDKVMIKVPDVTTPGSPVEATIPFRSIALFAADYFNGTAYGSVAASRSEWARVVKPAAQGQVPAGAKQALQNTPASKLKGIAAPAEFARRMNDFRSSLTVYSGPIGFVTMPAPAKQTASSPPQTASARAQTVSAPATGKPAVGQALIRNQPADLSGTIKAKSNTGTVNSPLGMFAVSGLEFNPGQLVQAVVEVEGFTIVSDWVETDGLLVSEIEHEQLVSGSNLKTENLSASNSFVIVSAIRSTSVPEGNVKLVKGADAKHASLVSPAKVPEFPEAARATLWFSQTIPLRPVEGHPGTAIAGTGEWQRAFQYQSPADVIDPAKNRKHPFELVSYTFKNQELGYRIFIDQCVSCTTPANVVQKLGSRQQTILPGMQQKSPAPARTAPVVQPKAPVRPGI
ncbi:MAG: hypothetical protein K0B05_11710 [Bacteroidales bacterium]|nr:hypothetical protein [Bacteroidales bacterium]